MSIFEAIIGFVGTMLVVLCFIYWLQHRYDRRPTKTINSVRELSKEDAARRIP